MLKGLLHGGRFRHPRRFSSLVALLMMDTAIIEWEIFQAKSFDPLNSSSYCKVDPKLTHHRGNSIVASVVSTCTIANPLYGVSHLVERHNLFTYLTTQKLFSM